MTRPEFNNIEDVANYIHELESKNEKLEAENKRLTHQHNNEFAGIIADHLSIENTQVQLNNDMKSLDDRVLVLESNQKTIVDIGADKIEKAEAEYNTIHYYDLKKIFAEMDDQLLIDNLRDMHTAWYHTRSIKLIADELERRLNLKES